MHADRPSSTPIRSVIAERVSRRSVLGGTAAGFSAYAMSGFVGSLFSGEAHAAGAASSLGFTELKRSMSETHAVAPGYDASVLVAWGDPLVEGLAAFDTNRLDAAEQASRFGYNCDFVAFLPLPKGSTSSDHGLLCVNHEYISPNVMFPGITEENAKTSMTAEQVAVGNMAVGHSVVEIRKTDGRWAAVAGSQLNRRVTMDTEIAIAGPAAGHPLMRTAADPSGTRVRGMIYNCGGGVTPWGTILTCEEGASDTFGGDPTTLPTAATLARYGFDGSDYYGRARFDERFDFGKEPNEANRFDWVVEIDPYDPASMPVKRTALGRMSHEAATVVTNADGRIVVYMGDDDYFEYCYRYVSNGRYDPARPESAAGLLDDGVLSVARFEADGTMSWLPLVHGTGPLTAENGFADQADVLLKTRLAADALGATPMDRPEDVEASPVTGRVYAVMTKNKKITAEKLNAANSRPENHYGHIIELIPPGERGAAADHTADRYGWDVFVLAGNPNDPKHGARFHPDTTTDGWFVNPDNIAFDPNGRLWVGTDGANDFDLPDGLYGVDTEGPARGLPKLLFACPRGAEATGPAFTPDGSTMFVAVQHPAEDSASLAAPTTRWPDFRADQAPRPSVVAITRGDGRPIGA